MKIALVIPESHSIVSDDNKDNINWDDLWEYQARKRLWSTPNLSLLTIAGMLPPDFSVDYIDLNYTNEISNHYDWIFFSPSTSQVTATYKLADDFRAQGSKVAMGGAHVSILPNEALEHADTVFIGEAEEIFPQFINAMREDKQNQIYKSTKFPSLEYCVIPRYDLIKRYSYKSIPIQTSRGCPHQCKFCISSTLYGKRYRRKSVEQISKELDAIQNVKEKPFVFFTDDNLLINNSQAMQLLSVIGERKLNWYAFSDAHITNRPQLLEKMAKAGCTQVLIGFESINPRNLAQINDSLWKMKRLTYYKNIIQTIQKYGIGVVGSFILGLDEDLPDVFENLYEFIEETRLYATNITILTPFPGTAVYKQLLEEERLLEKEWSKYTGFELTFVPKHIESRQFEQGFYWLNSKLNSPERIYKVIDYFKAIMKNKMVKA